MSIKVFAPASVANVSCGFDILGFPIKNIGDELEVKFNDSGKINITDIKGFAGNLSLKADKNVCGVIARAMLDAVNEKRGIDMVLTKGVLAGSGMGSSAASSAATAYALNKLLNSPFSTKELIPFAMLGEKLASGTAHADNVAPALLGGFTLVRTYDPLDIIQLPVPSELYVVILHPQVELLTEMSRNVLRKNVRLNTAVKQMGNIAGFVAGLYSSDYELISRSMEDYLVEPMRSVLIPGFDIITTHAKRAGALGSGISGSGPSIFALCKGKEKAMKVTEVMTQKAKEIKLDFLIHMSKLSTQGTKVINDKVLI